MQLYLNKELYNFAEWCVCRWRNNEKQFILSNSQTDNQVMFTIFFYLFQHLSTKLTLQLYCKLILDSEKEQFIGKNWIKKEPTGNILLHYVEWLKKIREGRRIFTCIDLGIFLLQKTLGVQIKETFDSQYCLESLPGFLVIFVLATPSDT